jgi:hypothetical protein
LARNRQETNDLKEFEQETFMAQWYAQVGGQRYGPVGDEEIRAWFAQGRVKPADYVWSEGMANWAQAGGVFGAAQPQTAGGSPAQGAVAGTGYTPPPIPAAYAGGAVTYYAKPHRGTAVLVLGILSIVFCFTCGWICGIIAWVMANNDLRDMAAGTMDPSGEGNTKAGRICGIIGTILGIVGVVLVIVEIIVFAAMVPMISHHSGPFR